MYVNASTLWSSRKSFIFLASAVSIFTVIIGVALNYISLSPVIHTELRFEAGTYSFSAFPDPLSQPQYYRLKNEPRRVDGNPIKRELLSEQGRWLPAPDSISKKRPDSEPVVIVCQAISLLELVKQSLIRKFDK